MYFSKLATCSDSLLDFHIITRSKTVPVFYIIPFLGGKTCFLYPKTYITLTTDKKLFRWDRFLRLICWFTNKEGSRQFDRFLYLSCTEILLYTEMNDWSVFCVNVCICEYVREWLPWKVALPIELTPCCRAGKAAKPLKWNRFCLYLSDFV